MARETSAEAYQLIKNNGLLSRRRFQVYDALYHYGPMTTGEIWRRLSPSGAQLNSISPRTAELKDRGVIRTIGERKCSVTGMNVLLWDVTRCLPCDVVKPERQRCHTCNGKGYLSSTPSFALEP